MQCFSTFAAAISAATDAVGPLTSVILSIDYTGTNESGSSLTWRQASGCGSYSASSMPTGWNDAISSVSNFNGCGTTLYQNTSFSGSAVSVAVDATATTLGGFNREASSQKWCAANSC
ncbi:MAG TPA: peptidase inhibitor family I36 protein [Acidothermaceae bacterium]